MTDAEYTDDIALLANTPTETKPWPDSLEQAAEGIDFYVNATK